MNEDLKRVFKLLLSHLEIAKDEDFVPENYSGLFVGYSIDDMTKEIIREVNKQVK